MKNLFLAGAKIIGLLSIFWAISFIPSIGWAIVQARTGSMSANAGAILNIYIEFAFLIVFGLLLLFRTEKLATLLKIKEESEIEIKLPASEILRIGFIFIGIYMLGKAIPEFFKTFYILSKSSEFTGGFEKNRYISELISSIVKIGLGSWLTFASRKVVRIITTRESKLNITNRSS